MSNFTLVLLMTSHYAIACFRTISFALNVVLKILQAYKLTHNFFLVLLMMGAFDYPNLSLNFALEQYLICSVG